MEMVVMTVHTIHKDQKPLVCSFVALVCLVQCIVSAVRQSTVFISSVASHVCRYSVQRVVGISTSPVKGYHFSFKKYKGTVVSGGKEKL